MKGKIGILSDTHGLLRMEVLQALEGCDAILHAGDINRKDILDELELIAPLYAVRGNNDKDWAEYLPLFLDFTLNGLHIYMTHKKKDLPACRDGYDLMVYGHSHRYDEKRIGDTLYLNPGSCGPRRFNQDITLAVLTPGEGENFQIQRIDIPHPVAKKKSPVLPGDMKKNVLRIMKEVEKGKNVSEISVKLRLEEELTEQICRLYLTHPGVTADQILAKMGM